jgi:hypothetical protein
VPTNSFELLTRFRNALVKLPVLNCKQRNPAFYN